MNNIVFGWSTERSDEVLNVEDTITRSIQRYQPLFGSRLNSVSLSNDFRGLVCIGSGLQDSNKLAIDDKKFICLFGNPSLTTPSISTPQSLNAQNIFDLTRSTNSACVSVNQINPPYALYWFDVENDELGCSVDGLGLERVFRATYQGLTVFSNKCWPIIQLLNRNFPPDKNAWGHWFTQGWFPRNATAFEGIEVFGMGEVYVSKQAGSSTISTDSITTWVEARQSNDDFQLISAATQSFQNLVKLYTNGNCRSDLTGGLDSRAICAAIVGANISCEFVTNGPIFSDDVIIARKIARHFKLNWSNPIPLSKTSQKTNSLGNILARFERMILWDEGHVEPNRFEHFPVDGAGDNCDIHFYGGQSEISRAFYYSHSIKDGSGLYASAVTNKFLEKICSYANETLRDSTQVEKHLRSLLLANNQPRLFGFDKLDFYYLSERIRRWGGAHLSANLLNRKISPYMTVDHIKLTFALTAWAKSRSAFQHHLINTFLPELQMFPVNRHLDLSPIWRWRNLAAFDKYRHQESTASQLAKHAEEYLSQLLVEDSPLFDLLKHEIVERRFLEFISSESKHYYFVLRVIAFQTWQKNFY